MNRRSLLQGFVLAASGLLVPEPVRVYSFVGGWAQHQRYDFILEGAGWPRISVSVAIEWLKREGRAGCLTRPENALVERLWNDAGDAIVRARIPALDVPPLRQLDGRSVV